MDHTFYVALGIKAITAIFAAFGTDASSINWDDLPMLTIEEKEQAAAKIKEEFAKKVDELTK